MSSTVQRLDGAAGLKRIARAIGRIGTADPPAGHLVWLGAGASQSAGIPLGSGVVIRLLDRFWRLEQQGASGPPTPYPQLSLHARVERETLLKRWALESELLPVGKESDLGAMYPHVLDQLSGQVERQEFILACIQEGAGRLNLTHLLLAQLIANGYVRTVLTTNFDDLMQRALQILLVLPSITDFRSVDSLRIRSAFVQIAYLHGMAHSYQQRHTGSELESMIGGLSDYFVRCMQDHGLIVVGYRGGDEYPMVALARALEVRHAGPGRGLFWVSFEERWEALSPQAQAVLGHRDTFWLPGWRSDDFMQQLMQQPGIGLGLPTFLSDPQELLQRLDQILPEGLTATAKTSLNRRPGSRSASEPPDVAAEFASLHELVVERDDPAAAVSGSTPLVLQAEQLLRDGKAPEALRLVESAIEDARDGPEMHSLLGKILVTQGHFARASDAFKRAGELGPMTTETLRQWAHALHRAGRYDEALTVHQRWFDLGVRDPWGMLWWGSTLMALGRFQEAIGKYQQALQEEPSLAWARKELADCLVRLGRIDEALENYRLTIEGSPDSPWFYVAYSDALADLGREAEALEVLDKVATSTDLFWLHRDRGELLLRLGRHGEARSAFQKAETVATDDSERSIAARGIVKATEAMPAEASAGTSGEPGN